MAAGLWRYWEIRGHLSEGRAWLQRTVDAVGGEISALRANALTGAGSLAFMQGDFQAASSFHEASLALHREMGDRQSVGYAANNLANTAVQLGDHARARALYEEAIAVSRVLGDETAAAFGAINLADVATRQGDYSVARALHEEILATIRQRGDRWTEAFAPRHLRHCDQPGGRSGGGTGAPYPGAGDPRGDGRPARRRARPDPPGRPGPGRRRHRSRA